MKKTKSQNNSEKFKIFGEAYSGISISHQKTIQYFEQFFIPEDDPMFQEIAITSMLIKAVDGVVLKALPVAQKFYLPYATQIIDTKDFKDEETLNKLRLPYNEIAILTEGDFLDINNREYTGSRITVAISPNSVYWEELEENLLHFRELFTGEEAIDKEDIVGVIFNISKRTAVEEGINTEKWMIYPGCIILTREPRTHRDTGKPAIRQAIIGTPYKDTASYYQDVQNMITSNTYDTMNLCLLLSLKNVEQQEIAETATSKKRRRQKNVRNLIDDVSYKVLIVKGEVWDGNNIFEDAEEDGNGNKREYRSHHRRGHIKRRKTGNYWWSPTLVHGGTRGFVEKDYKVEVNGDK